MSPVDWAGTVSAWVYMERASPGLPECHVITKLNFDVCKPISHIDVNRRKETQTVCEGIFAMINKLFAANCKLFAIVGKPFSNRN